MGSGGRPAGRGGGRGGRRGPALPWGKAVVGEVRGEAGRVCVSGCSCSLLPSAGPPVSGRAPSLGRPGQGFFVARSVEGRAGERWACGCSQGSTASWVCGERAAAPWEAGEAAWVSSEGGLRAGGVGQPPVGPHRPWLPADTGNPQVRRWGDLLSSSRL